jgi:hypothetical protein
VAEKLYSAKDVLKADQLPLKYAYHGTFKAVWCAIIDMDLIPGGIKEDRTRFCNHFSPYPAGDTRNVAGARYNAEVSIEYDLVEAVKQAKAEHPDWEAFYPEMYCIVWGHVVPGKFARRVIETKTKFVLWENAEMLAREGQIASAPDTRLPFQRLPKSVLLDRTTTEAELQKLRELTKADRVFWILPAIKPHVQDIVRRIAAEHGDTIVPITRLQPDGVHPTGAGYKAIADQTK